MISKQKLLQWIEGKRYVFSGPYDDGETEEEKLKYAGALMMLSLLDQAIEWGHFNQEEGERDGRETNDQQSDQHIQEIQHEPEGSFLTTALHNVDPAFR